MRRGNPAIMRDPAIVGRRNTGVMGDPILELTRITLRIDMVSVCPRLMVWTHSTTRSSASVSPRKFPSPPVPTRHSIRTDANSTSCRRGRKLRLLAPKLLPVQFMTIFKLWQVAGLCRERLGSKVLMLQSIDSVDSSEWVKF